MVQKYLFTDPISLTLGCVVRSGQGYIDFLKWNTLFFIQESNS